MKLAALPFPAIDPVALSLGPLQVHWYGLGYVAGILFGLWYAHRLVNNRTLWRSQTISLQAHHIDDFLVWAVLGIVVGGRLGYIFFYDFARFLADPWSLFAVWNGGMSFHGGVLGLLVVMILYAKRNGISSFRLFDVITASAPVGIFLVRIANFINAELYGKPTQLPWGVVFPYAGDTPRHPSQLYEAMLEGLIMFLLLRLATHYFKVLVYPGMVAGIFFMWYGTGRILVEFVRLPDAQIGYLYGGWLTMGMVLSFPMIAIGLIVALTAPGRQANRTKKASCHE